MPPDGNFQKPYRDAIVPGIDFGLSTRDDRWLKTDFGLPAIDAIAPKTKFVNGVGPLILTFKIVPWSCWPLERAGNAAATQLEEEVTLKGVGPLFLS